MLILLFYIGSVLLCTAYVAMYIILAINPEKDAFLYHSESIEPVEVLNGIGMFMISAINWLVCATLFQLSVRIKVIFNDLNRSQGQKITNVMSIIAGVMVIVELLGMFLIPAFLPLEKRSDGVALTLFVTNLILIVTYIFTVVYLRRAMSQP